MNITSLTVAQLKEAIAIKEKIEALEQELESILGNSAEPAKAVPAMPVAAPKRKKRKMSAAAKAKISAAQKERWAKKNGLQKAETNPAHISEPLEKAIHGVDHCCRIEGFHINVAAPG